MALESVTYIGDLNPANPPGTDPKSQGDDHLRNIKKGLLDSLPGFLGLVLVTGTEAQGSTASDFTVTVTPAPSAYTSPFIILFEAAHTSVGAATVQINALGTKPLVALDGSALQAGDIVSGSIVCAFYDGTSFLLTSGNDRANRGGDTYTGTHDYTAAVTEVAEPAAADNSAKAAPTSYVDRADALKANLSGATYTGTHDFTAGTTKVATAAPGTNDNTAADTAFVVQQAFLTALPAQAGNAGKVLTTDGSSAFWANSAGAALAYYGDGSDGNVTVSGSVTLSRDMYYSNLTMVAGAALDCRGYRIFVANVLDLTAAPAGAIRANGGAGGNGGNGSASAGAAGTAGATASSVSVGVGAAGLVGPAAPNAGSGGAGSNGSNGGNGGVGASSGASGAGSASAGHASLTGGAVTAWSVHRVLSNAYLTTTDNVTTLTAGGASGGSGSPGSGDNTNWGGSGGGSGAGGSIVQIYARFVNRGVGTAIGAIQAKGGAGGSGGSATVGSCGGGGGGGGAGGGWVYLVCETLQGASATNAIDVTGGSGGAGGAGVSSTFHGGGGGGSGAGGRLTLAQMDAAIYADTLSSAAAVAPTTTAVAAGAAATTANVAQFSL